MANKFKEIKALAEALDMVNNFIEESIGNKKFDYVPVGKVQATDWMGILLWEDEEKTIPKMRDKWDNVPKEDISEEAQQEIDALVKIQKYLEKMI